MVRPMSKSGRPMSGVARPGTNNRPTSSSRGMTGRVQTALRNRTGTSRPITTGGRCLKMISCAQLNLLIKICKIGYSINTTDWR